MADLSVTVDGQDVGLGRLFGDLTDGIDGLVRRLNQLDGTTSTARADLDTSRVDQGLNDVEQRSGQAGERAGENLSSGMAAKLAGLAAVGTAVGGFLIAGLSQAMERETATAQLAVRLGATGEAAGNFGRIAGELYSNNFGQSMEDVNNAVVAVHQNIGESFADTDEIVSNSAATALSLADAFGIDVADAAKSVGQLLRTGLADDAGVAFDVITAGFQQGVDRSGDFLDTLNEYSPQFAKLGIDAHTAIGLLRQGLQGGARDADIVADSFKEFSLRAVEGGDEAKGAFKAMGLDANKMVKIFAAGGPEAATALDTVIDRLNGMKDPVARNAAGVALFGTQFEDMGVAFASLDPSSAVDALGDVEGAAGKMNDTLGDTAAGRIETMRRALETGLVDFFGNQVIPMFETIAGWGEQLFGPAWEPVKGFLGFLAGTGGVVVGVIMAVAVATWAWSTAMGALSAASLPISGTVILIAAGIALLVAGVVYAWNNFEGFRNVVLAVWAGIQTAFTTAWAIISTVFTAIVGAVQAVVDFFPRAWTTATTATTTAWNAIGAFLLGLWTGLLDGAQATLGAIGAFFVGLWQGVVDTTVGAWNGIVAFVTGIWNGIVTIATTVWNAITDYFARFYAAHRELVDSVWNWIVGFLTGIWQGIYESAMAIWTPVATFFTWLWGMVRDGYIIAWNAISAAGIAIWTTISTFFTTALNVFLVFWNMIWTTISTAWSSFWNAVSAVAQAVWAIIESYLQSRVNAFSTFWSGVWNSVSTFFTGIWNTIRSTVESIWGAVDAWIRGKVDAFNSWWSGIWNTVVGAFDAAWGKLKGIAESIWGGVVAVFKGGVNAVIDAINWLISKVNVVLKFFLIPEIPAVPKMESGGVLGAQMLAAGGQVGPARVGGGFTTNGPVAIVGEGNRAHPEYVIPTDPKYRNRALALYNDLGASLMADGGVLGWIGDTAGAAWGGITAAASSVGSAISDAASWIGGAASGTFEQIKGAIRGMLPGGVFSDIGVGLATKLLDGIKKKIEEAFAAMTAAAGTGGAAVPAGPIRDVVQRTAAQFGWGAGPQWDALAWIIGHESGWNPNAQNPTSTAYGLFQFLNGTWASTGIAKTSNPSLQALAGMRYIGSRYGSPIGAKGFWQSHGWYESGGMLPTGRAMADGGIVSRPTFGLVGEAGPEAVVPLTRPGRAAQILSQAGLSGGMTDTAGIEARLDALAETLERRGAAATINVHDQSGDPAETARATVLALRIS